MNVIDPVCKMVLEDSQASFKSEYKGKTYYFCSLSDKKMFDKDPKRYLDFGKSV